MLGETQLGFWFVRKSQPRMLQVLGCRLVTSTTSYGRPKQLTIVPRYHAPLALYF